MPLYHGSNVNVCKHKIIKSKRLLDFGIGFYLTSDFDQAKKWAERTANRRNEGLPQVSVFQLDESKINSLKLLVFELPILIGLIMYPKTELMNISAIPSILL